jgi:hypothetical protein
MPEELIMAAKSGQVHPTIYPKNGNTARGLRPACSSVVCVVDMDNVCSRRGKYGRRAWACLDVLQFGSALKERGVFQGTICQHQPFSAYGARLWDGLGLKTVSTGENADDRVKLEAVTYALEAGVDWLILVASDGGYYDTLISIQECGIKIELWALREAVSRDLIFLADRVRWIDDLVDEPRPPGNAPANHNLAACANAPPTFNDIAACTDVSF